MLSRKRGPRSKSETERRRVGLEIRTERTKRRLTQEDLAGILGVSWVTISRWERGVTYPAAKYVGTLTRVLGIRVL